MPTTVSPSEVESLAMRVERFVQSFCEMLVVSIAANTRHSVQGTLSGGQRGLWAQMLMTCERDLKTKARWGIIVYEVAEPFEH